VELGVGGQGITIQHEPVIGDLYMEAQQCDSRKEGRATPSVGWAWVQTHPQDQAVVNLVINLLLVFKSCVWLEFSVQWLVLHTVHCAHTP
jgi:hypothetical protein